MMHSSSPLLPAPYQERYASAVAPPSVTFSCHFYSLLSLNYRKTAYTHSFVLLNNKNGVRV